MLEVVRFLESMGSNAAYGESEQAYLAQVAALDVEESARVALMHRDAASLNDAVGGRSSMVCAIFVPDEEIQIAPEVLN